MTNENNLALLANRSLQAAFRFTASVLRQLQPTSRLQWERLRRHSELGSRQSMSFQFWGRAMTYETDGGNADGLLTRTLVARRLP